jgi:hypothetical protein
LGKKERNINSNTPFQNKIRTLVSNGTPPIPRILYYFESKKKIGANVAGEKNGMYGRKHSAETALKISEKAKERLANSLNPNAKQYIITKPDGTEEEIIDLKSYCKNNGFSCATFQKLLYQNVVCKKGNATGYRVRLK